MIKKYVFTGLTAIIFFSGMFLYADFGDVNNDTYIDIVDALLVAQFYVGLGPQGFEESNADVNCDSSIDIIDALFIAQYYVGLISSFPCSPTPLPTPGQNSYSLQSEYSQIRSYPGGGGIFIIYIEPEISFSGEVHLSIAADQGLNASLNGQILDSVTTVSELTIFPDSTITTALYIIEINAMHGDDEQSIRLETDVMDWETGDPGTYLGELYKFDQWLQENRPDLDLSLYTDWTLYHTYPQTLIVEHLTFLDDDWEIRLCYHVMIPPDDWSRLLVRKRNEIDAVLALYRGTDETGIIYETDISEYPIMYGY